MNTSVISHKNVEEINDKSNDWKEILEIIFIGLFSSFYFNIHINFLHQRPDIMDVSL